MLEAFQAEAIERTFAKSGAARLLEIGCGSGVYLRYAAMRNPELTAVGVELQPAVAEMARTNLRSWGLEGRVKVETGDFRARTAGELFDIATPGPSTDRVLNGPTNDVWIDPWRRYLESRGVGYHVDSKAVSVSFDLLRALTVRPQDYTATQFR